MKRHFSSASAPGTRLVTAIAPGFTIGLVRPSPLRSTAVDRVERQPGGVHADQPPQLLPAELLADEGVDERLRDAHDRQLRLDVADGVEAAADAGDADPEESFRHLRQRRVDLRERSLVVRPVALVRLDDDSPDEVGVGS